MRTYGAEELDFLINKEELRDLLQTKPYRHTLSLIFDWTIIVSTMLIWLIYPVWWLYPIVVLVIGARMHALAVLMHDASHYRFIKNKKLNDILTNVLTMYPLFITIEDYRRSHIAHHTKLNTYEDPDWNRKLGDPAFTFPQSKTHFILRLLSYLVFYQGILDAFLIFKAIGLRDRSPLRIVFYILLFGAITLFHAWSVYLSLWIVPYLTTFFLFLYIRSVAEHFGDLKYDGLLTSTRTVKANAFERFFLAPHHVAFHLEHHLYSAVPFYNLPALHKRLMTVKEYERGAHITNGYARGLMEEISGGD